MKSEESRREEWPFIPIPIPLPIPVPAGFFDEWLTRLWPQEYRESLTHLQNARIEVLKAIDAAIKTRIEVLKRVQREAEPRKEKVQVE